MSIKKGLQLYSVRDRLELDYEGTLNAVRAMGYEGVELPGLGGYTGKEIKRMTDAAGLAVTSAHVPFSDMLEDTEKTFSEYRDAGCHYIVIPWLGAERRPDGELFTKTVEEIGMLGRKAAENGLYLMYHNHDFEFTKVNGKYGLDIIYDSVPAEFLGAEIDTCWVKVAGLNPAEYLKRFRGRAPLVHFKDFYFEGKLDEVPYELIGKDGTKIEKPKRPNFEFRPVGHGLQDVASLVEASEYVGAEWIIVEQDNSTDRPTLEAVRMSIDFLNGIM